METKQKKRLTCPACSSSDGVVKHELTSDGGEGLIKLIKRKGGRVLRKGLHAVDSRNPNHIRIYRCKDCGNTEIWDIKNRICLLRTDVGTSRSFKLEYNKMDLINGLIISFLLAACGTVLGFWVISGGLISEIPFNVPIEWGLVIVPVVIVSFMVLIFVISYAVLYTIDKNIGYLEFTLKLHKVYFGAHMYFLEYHSRKIRTDFVASLKRATFGAVLVLGIGVLAVENFLTIPDLIPYFPYAALVTLTSLSIALPLIIIALYISPLLTKEINLYYHNKKARTVKNVGAWLDNVLKFFAVIDIVIVTVILIDSSISDGWLLLIIAFILLVFSLFVIFTLVFNRYYHSRLKEKFLEHLKGKYHLPIRSVDLFHRYYYCYQCGELTDAIQLDNCIHCGARIHKCGICNEYLDVKNVMSNRDPGKEDVVDTLYGLLGSVQTRMSGGGGGRSEFPHVLCPTCKDTFHLDEFMSWIRMRKKCPTCKEKVNILDIFG